MPDIILMPVSIGDAEVSKGTVKEIELAKRLGRHIFYTIGHLDDHYKKYRELQEGVNDITRNTRIINVRKIFYKDDLQNSSGAGSSSEEKPSE